MINSIKKKYIEDKQIFLQIDERADVFSNIMYSNLIAKGSYEKELEQLQQDKYILPPFVFPKKKFENKIKKI